MKNRCFNERDYRTFVYYGGRGITVCERWCTDFSAFAADVSPDPGPPFQIGRIDNDGNYEPGNVRWETPEQNARNRRRSGPMPGFKRRKGAS